MTEKMKGRKAFVAGDPTSFGVKEKKEPSEEVKKLLAEGYEVCGEEDLKLANEFVDEEEDIEGNRAGFSRQAEVEDELEKKKDDEQRCGNCSWWRNGKCIQFSITKSASNTEDTECWRPEVD